MVTGALILEIFATIWWVVGMRAAGQPSSVIYPLALIMAIVLGTSIQRERKRQRGIPDSMVDATERGRRDRVVMWASAGEGVALFIAAGVVLPTLHRADLTAPVVALIVGAHFIPLAHGLRAPRHYVTAAAMMAVGVVGWMITDVPTRITAVSGGAAALLWLTAIAMLRQARVTST